MHVPVRHTGQLVQKQPGAGSETDHGAEITRVRRSVVGVCNASGFRRRDYRVLLNGPKIAQIQDSGWGSGMATASHALALLDREVQ